MKKSYFFILVSILVLSVTGFFLYLFLQKKQDSSVWKLIPENAFFLAEVRKPVELLESKSSVWQDFIILTGFEDLLENVQNLCKQDADLQAFLKNNPVFISFHLTGQNDFGEVFYLPLNSVLTEKLTKKFQQDPSYQLNFRTFQGIRIQEISLKSNSKKIFSFVLHENYVVGSFTPFLIEDNIRHWQSGGFFSQKIPFQPLSNENNSPLQLYITGKGFSQFVNLFVNEENQAAFSRLSQTFSQTEFQTEVLDNQLVMFGNSRTITDKEDFSFFDVFENQQPQALAATALIPENTGLLYHLGFSDGSLLLKNLNRFWQKNSPVFFSRRESFLKKYKIDLDTAGNFLGSEIIIGRLEGNNAENNRFMLLHTKNISEAATFFNNLTKTIDIQDNTSPFLENYAARYLRQIHISGFPELLFGGLAADFSQCFYAEYDNYIIISGNLLTLKNLLDNSLQGNVWKNSESKKQFLGKIQAAANFSMFLETPRAWTFLPETIHRNWQPKLAENAGLFKNFEQVVLQIHQTKSHVYQTSLVAFHQRSTTAEKVLGKFYPVFTYKLDTGFAGKIFLAKNPAENTFHGIVQDKANILHCFDKNGKPQFTKFLNHPIEGEVATIDFFKNNKPNYATIAQNELFIFTNKGEQAEGFPVIVPATGDLHLLSVLDYDKNKDYRFGISDKAGNLFLYNKSGKLLEGWNPKKTDYRLASPLRFLRVANKDYLFAMQLNGTAQVWNRRGQNISPFPLKTGERLSPGIFIKNGATADETVFSAVSEEGQLIQFTLSGKVQSKKQFIRTTRESVFRLCVEQQEKDYFIVRQDLNNVTVLDKNTNILISKDLENINKNCLVQYFDFGADVKVFFITQPDLGKTFVFDYSGKPIGDSFENQSAVAVLYVSDLNKLLIMKAKDRNFGMVSVKIK